MALVLLCLKFRPGDAEKGVTAHKEIAMLMTKLDKPKNKLLTVKEVATYLVVTERTVYRLIKDPVFPAFKVGGQWRFKIDLIDDWMRRDRSEAPSTLAVLSVDDVRVMEDSGRVTS
jgi:excisionase family DNA binding protein